MSFVLGEQKFVLKRMCTFVAGCVFFFNFIFWFFGSKGCWDVFFVWFLILVAVCFVADLGIFPMKFSWDPPPLLKVINSLSSPLRTWMEYWNVPARITIGPWSLGNAPREALGILRPQHFFFCRFFVGRIVSSSFNLKTQNIKGSKNANMGIFLIFRVHRLDWYSNIMSHVDMTGGPEKTGQVCGRFCIRFVYGNCHKGENCEFCHLEHKESKLKLDKVWKKIPKLWGGIVFVCVRVPLNPRKVFRCKEIFLSKATSPKNLKRKKCEKHPLNLESKRHLPAAVCFIFWVHPPPCNSGLTIYICFLKGPILTFIFHCYRVGGLPNYIYSLRGRVRPHQGHKVS